MIEYFKLETAEVKKVDRPTNFDHLFKPTDYKCECGRTVMILNKMIICECGKYEIIK
jgi:hypothetical protein